MEKKIDKLLLDADKLEEAAIDIALIKIERMARAILRKRKHLKEFMMSMGTYCFFDWKGNVVDPIEEHMNSSYDYYYADKYAYFKPINDFIGKYNDRLKLTGSAMTFTATSKTKTNW